MQLSWLRSVLEVVSLVVGAFGITAGLFFTGWQLKEAARQAEASRVYEIQKDGREILFKILEDDLLRRQIFPENSTDQQKNDISEKLFFGIGMQYYSSVYEQSRLGLIGRDSWGSTKRDMCDFIHRPSSENLVKSISPDVYGSSFYMEIKSCIK